MTYQPLHHKYRPQTFADLVGQEAIATTLTNALRQQRIAPAYLFTGARGTGKTSSARILAKSLNCLTSATPTETPCGQCDVCRAIANGSALDVIEIDAASNTGVDNIRELIERAQFAPVQCRYKVYIIDEVHMLSTAAFNALLKTLEEPPDRVVFVLATTDPQRVLPTIISRCQRFDFRRIPLDAMVQHLKLIADKEGIAIVDDAITLVAQLSQGGLRDAESLLDQLSLLPSQVTVDRVWDLVGAVPERDLLALLEAIAASDPEALLDTARRLMDRGREPMIVLQNLASFYRDLLIAKSAPARADLVALTPPTWAKLCDFAHAIERSTILTGQQHLRSCEAQLKHTTQPRLWLEVALIGLLPGNSAPLAASSLTVPQPDRPAQSPIPPQPKATASPPAKLPQTSTASATPPEPTVPTKPPIPTKPALPIEPPASESNGSERTPQPQLAQEQDLGIIWQQALGHLQPASTRMLLGQQGCLLELTHEEARIGIVQQWYQNAKNRIPNLGVAFEKALGRPIQVRLEGGTPESIRAARENSAVAPPAPPLPPEPTYQPPPVLNDASPPPIEPSVPSPLELPPRSPQVSPTPAADAWQEDEATRAANQLADFFAGKVVNLDASDAESEPASAVTEPTSTTWKADEVSTEPPEADEEDFPF